MFDVSSQVIFKEQGIKAFERPLNGEGLLQKLGAVYLVLNRLGESIDLAANNLGPMDCPFF